MVTRGTIHRRFRWNRILENLGTLALSFILALIIWLIAITQENPLVQGEFPEPIPIVVRGSDGTLQPIQNLGNQTAIVTVRAPSLSWERLTTDDFTAFIDLDGLAAGEHEVKVDVTVVDPKVKVLGVQVPYLRVELDEVIVEELPVRVAVMDAPAFGYDAQTPIAEPDTVTISGPATQVNQVAEAKVEVFLNNAKSQVDREATVDLINGQNQRVDQVVAEPARIRVGVPVEQRPGRKEVAVRPNLIGQPESGYRLSSVRVNPSTVVLIGDNEALAQVPGFVETTEISLERATASIEERLDLVLPENVSAVDGNSVIITATITPLNGGRTLKQEPVVQGLDAGLTADVALETVEVILSGPLPLLESMEPDDMFVILDLAGLLPGVHAVDPRVILPTGIREEGLLPETVEVVIRAAENRSPAAAPKRDGATIDDADAVSGDGTAP